MNRAKVQQVGRDASHTDPAFGTSISEIDRKTIPVITLPTQPSFFSADSEGYQQLDQLYPLSGIHSYLNEQLRPIGIDPSLLSHARFQAELISCGNLIRLLAATRRAEARRFGRLSRLLDEHDALCRLAQLYASALLQG